MNVELGIKLQAHLDGELTGREAQEVAALLEKDAGARSIFAELQQTKSLLAGNEPEFRLPESREFFWSKIEREISRQEATPTTTAPTWMMFLRRHFAALSTTGVAAALVMLLAVNWMSPAMFEEIDNPLDDSDSFSFRSESQQMTLVWIANPYADADETTEAAPDIQ
jgi:anti-sigma factor RsiW